MDPVSFEPPRKTGENRRQACMVTPRITVAMSVFNNATYIARAVESILAQSFTDFEFIIVDDGSTDDSVAIVERVAGNDSRVNIQRQANAGLIVSLNRIVDMARAPFIARMDGDDIALPDRFARQIAHLDAHPDLGVLGTGCTCIDEEGRPSSTKFDNATDADDLVADLINGPPLCHPSVMMRTEVLRAVGGYHRAFKHCEDYDLWLRLSELTRMGNLPDRLLLYRQSATQVSNRHALTQKIGAAIAWEAHVERIAGRRDPTVGLIDLPPIASLDELFGRHGVTKTVREKAALGIVYAPAALRAEGYDLIIEQVHSGGSVRGFWRTVARLLKMGEGWRALRLAQALLAR